MKSVLAQVAHVMSMFIPAPSVLSMQAYAPTSSNAMNELTSETVSVPAAGSGASSIFAAPCTAGACGRLGRRERARSRELRRQALAGGRAKGGQHGAAALA